MTALCVYCHACSQSIPTDSTGGEITLRCPRCSQRSTYDDIEVQVAMRAEPRPRATLAQGVIRTIAAVLAFGYVAVNSLLGRK